MTKERKKSHKETTDNHLGTLLGETEVPSKKSKKKVVQSGESYHIFPKLMHRISSLNGDATILEVGTKLEDDVVLVEE